MVRSINKCNIMKYDKISISSLYPNKPHNFFIRHIISLLQGHVYYNHFSVNLILIINSMLQQLGFVDIGAKAKATSLPEWFKENPI